MATTQPLVDLIMKREEGTMQTYKITASLKGVTWIDAINQEDAEERARQLTELDLLLLCNRIEVKIEREEVQK